MTDLNTAMAEAAGKVNELLLALIARTDTPENRLYDAMRYSAMAGGKRLRPFLVLQGASMFNVAESCALRAAAAVEMIHTYSLIHDDLPAMDNDDLRRGMPTVHRQFNEAVALLAGDTLLTFAFEKIAAAPLPAARVVAIMGIVTRCIGKDGMARGQALDLEFAGDAAAIAEIHRLKTAELIRGSLLAAAVVAGFGRRRRELLAAAGTALGLGFQLADDLLDVAGDERLAGKKLRKDGAKGSPNAALYLGTAAVQAAIDAHYREALARIAELGIVFPPFLRLAKSMLYRSR